jgi:hypothetical protein
VKRRQLSVGAALAGGNVVRGRKIVDHTYKVKEGVIWQLKERVISPKSLGKR